MRFFLFIIIISSWCLNCHSQILLPNQIPFKTFDYLNKSKVKSTYNFSKNEKKAFLFFDIKTEYLADIMFTGCDFVFKEKKITIFPIYFSGQLVKKTTNDIGTKIPTQLYRTPETSIFKDFNIKESDLPILVVYNEKNELCGFSKNVDKIGDIECASDTIKYKILRLKFLVEADDKGGLKPYPNKMIYILSGKNNDTIANIKTSNIGDLNVEIPDLTKDYLIKINESDKNINFVVLGTQTGVIVGKFKTIDQGFEYKITKSKLKTLPGIKKEDNIDSKFADLKNNPEDDFIITESLYYELGKSELSQSSKDLLVKIKNGLNLYPYRLLVFSHTDAQGNDDDNLKLSAKRSQAVIEYLISLGIKKERLSAEGKGETQIRNRCKNDIECSDKEHEYNRRTEFLFSK